MSHDQSPAVIDATDAQVLAPESALPQLTEQQVQELNGYEGHLQKLRPRITARLEQAFYLALEAGFYLLKARAVYPVSHVGHRSDGQFPVSEDGGFRAWLMRPEIGIPKTTAYRYMQEARNRGLTAESALGDLEAIKNAHLLKGITPEKFGRRPVDKTLNEHSVGGAYSAHELYQLEVQSIQNDWEKTAKFIADSGLEKGSWVHLNLRQREGLYHICFELQRILKDSLREVPGSKSAASQAGKPDQSPDTETEPAHSRLQSLACFEKSKKGERWWYGFEEGGEVQLQLYRGDVAELGRLKKERQDLTIVGPFKASSVKYAKAKVKRGTQNVQLKDV